MFVPSALEGKTEKEHLMIPRKEKGEYKQLRDKISSDASKCGKLTHVDQGEELRNGIISDSGL